MPGPPPRAAIRGLLTLIDGATGCASCRATGLATSGTVHISFWARGYFVSTVGRDEEVIRNYIRNQEEKDNRLEQMNLWR